MDSAMQIYESHEIDYEVPFNFKEIDRALFYGENFKFTIPSVVLFEVKLAFVSKDTIFSNGRVYDRFIRHTKVSFWNKVRRTKKLFSHKIIRRESKILGFQVWSNNYFHWMTETLPAIWVMNKKLKGVSVLIPRYLSSISFIHQSLDYLEISWESFDDDETVLVSKLFCIDVPHVGRFNHALLKDFSNSINYAVLKNESHNTLRRLFVSRRKANRRRIINEEALCENLNNMGFEVIVLEELSIKEQVKYFQESSVIVSSHGAGLSNVMFMKPGSKVFELKASDNDFWCFFSISRVFDLNYGYMLCESDGQNHRDADITVNIDTFNQLLSDFILLN